MVIKNKFGKVRINMSKNYTKLRKIAKTQRLLSAIIAILCVLLMGIAGGSDKGDISMSATIIGTILIIAVLSLTAILFKETVIKKNNIKKSIKLRNKSAANRLTRELAD